MTLAMVLTALIVGSATTLYGFIALRTADAIARFSTIQSCTTLTSTIRSVGIHSFKAETKSLGTKTALVCTIPKDEVDRAVDGVPDYPLPDKTDKMLREEFSGDQRLWFYSADATGTPGTNGNFWFLAIRSDNNNPTAADINRNWSFLSSGTPRVEVPGSVTFTVIASLRLARVRVQIAGEQVVDGGLASTRRPSVLDLNQRFYWRCGN